MTTAQLILPAVEGARFEPPVWDAFVETWGELEADRLVPPSVMEPVTAFSTAHVTWVVARVNGVEKVAHGCDGADAARAMFLVVHGRAPG